MYGEEKNFDHPARELQSMKRLFLFFYVWRREKFSPSGAGASVNETTISLSLCVEKRKFSPSGAEASVNETTISLSLCMEKRKIFTIRRGSLSK
ncbi:MAG: hypothetical protein F6K22_23630 [Okeania sp. SIO2F4]|uniref:hypothetical protein n=1 Tax=Okeania sp. SIO2F4 TaxID=2607790 RepID=UPI00142BB7EB|nr:hypothetical protein [Okeania sp. SIO2F4]NES05538.1 hypothetical protein [Okeania sp. SIO2F4]